MQNDVTYFDNNATTRPLPEVVDAMMPVLRDSYANPSSVHQFGQSARYAVECAREQVANLIGAEAKEIVFTSGGTEAINLAIRGCLAMRPDKRRFVTTAVEHSAVLRVAEELAREGYEVEFVGVDGDGRLDEAQWAAALTDETALASIIHVNNETGVVFDVSGPAAAAAEKGIPVHVDAIQSTGKLPIAVHDWAVQFLSLSAHKFHGPKGAGALYVRRRTRLGPLLLGGSQERNLRGGTENVAGIVGMGLAADLALRDMAQTSKIVGRLRDKLEAELVRRAPDAHVIGAGAERLFNTSNVAFSGLAAEAILILFSEAGLCASSGAACSSGSLEPSHVLKAMHIDPVVAQGAIRFSLSKFNTDAEVDKAVAIIPDLLARLSSLRGA
ncbi:MAG: aminotransferase class V-fold PLP-dependent enzyme [Planctomycetes bacterium]|nr:aminotransferase class V-fold PLP-dependent enzyme [Planctomycetota bacterium]